MTTKSAITFTLPTDATVTLPFAGAYFLAGLRSESEVLAGIGALYAIGMDREAEAFEYAMRRFAEADAEFVAAERADDRDPVAVFMGTDAPNPVYDAAVSKRKAARRDVEDAYKPLAAAVAAAREAIEAAGFDGAPC